MSSFDPFVQRGFFLNLGRSKEKDLLPQLRPFTDESGDLLSSRAVLEKGEGTFQKVEILAKILLKSINFIEEKVRRKERDRDPPETLAQLERGRSNSFQE